MNWPAPQASDRIPTAASDLDSWVTYSARAQQVYWKRTTPACRVHGPEKAECLLAPNHNGPHYGNGYDTWGPRGPIEWKASA